ncbi:MAG TPA: DUF4197 domain-containing protein [Burkholderiales bacterium]|nr:DUF4197 domain-containing protein [Burkholderiales bacterium]
MDRLTQQEAIAGLKTALERGAHVAVARLGKVNGFLANPKVRIPLPESLQRAEEMARRFGFDEQADELIVAMNRAAEAAVPEARKLLIDAARQMTVKDAKAIISGGNTAGTAYFRRTSHKQLHARFLPIVKRSTEKVGVARYYREFAAPAASFGFISAEAADLDEYVTQKALDGLYFMLAEEENKIRRDPVGTGSEILKKVFGALL